MEPAKMNPRGVPGGGLVLESTLTHEHPDGAAHEIAAYRPCSIQVTGIFDGGSLTVQGSNDVKDPIAWFDLHDPVGDVLEFTEDSLRGIHESAVWVRLVTSGGDAKMSLIGKLFVQQL